MEELEAGLVERSGLRDAVAVAAAGRGDLEEELGAAAATYFEKIAGNGMRIGLSCGFTLCQTIRQLRERRFRDLVLYPLSGESTLRQVDLFPNTLVGMMAAKYRPHVQAYALPVQHLLSLGEIERERRRLLRDPDVRTIYEAAQAVDIALVGIGLIGEQTQGFCSLAEAYGVSVGRLRHLGVVGEINYQPFDRDARVVAEVAGEARRGGVPAPVGPADGLGPDRVDDAEPQEVGRGDLHGLRGLGRLRGVAPEDRGAALGRDDRVDRVLEHQHAVAHADREGPAAPPLARHDGDERRAEPRHLVAGPPHRLGLAPLPRAAPRVRARPVGDG